MIRSVDSDEVVEIRTLDLGDRGEKEGSVIEVDPFLNAQRQVSDIFYTGFADLLIYARARFGEERVESISGDLQFFDADYERASAIALLPSGVRHNDLTAEHYWTVGRLRHTSDVHKIRWLKIAREEQLNPLDLRRSIGAGKVTRSKDSERAKGARSGILTPAFLVMYFLKWESQNAEGTMKSDLEGRLMCLDEFAPIENFLVTLRQSLSD